MSLPLSLSIAEPSGTSPSGCLSATDSTPQGEPGTGAQVIPFARRRASAAPANAGFVARSRSRPVTQPGADIPWRTGFQGSPVADLDPSDAADRAILDRYATRYVRDEMGESWVVRLARLPGGEMLCRAGRLARDDEHTYHRFFEAPDDYHPLPF